ncbi:MAG TPA: ATP-binding protein [Candidatus Limnocylindria bacterium]|jgi:anti-sigma regulatory factor (Ser/Thr protein kinase)|nr:ATP-binding protein [Candidatus Limnocylindria bacterium]
MHWTFDARDARAAYDLRTRLLAYLRTKGHHDADYASAELVVGELVGNVVRHAPGVAEVAIEWHEETPVLHVLDHGPGYEGAAALPSATSETGRGLFLVSALTREFSLTRRPKRGSHARAVLPIPRRTTESDAA